MKSTASLLLLSDSRSVLTTLSSPPTSISLADLTGIVFFLLLFYQAILLFYLSRLRCNGHSLLLSSYLFRIGRIENPSCSACGHSSQDIFHLILHCPATDSFAPLAFWRLSVSLRPLVQTLGSCPSSGAPWSSAMPPSLGRGWVTTTTRTTINNHLNVVEQSETLSGFVEMTDGHPEGSRYPEPYPYQTF